VRADHVEHVPDCGAPQEQRWAEHGGEAELPVAAKGKEADRGESEAGVADLGLERAVLKAMMDAMLASGLGASDIRDDLAV
jgi:hypothetical protein